MKYIKIFTLLLFTIGTAKAQFVPNYKRAADVYFHNKEYYAASEYYKKALQISPDSTGIIKPYAYEFKAKSKDKKADEYEYLVYQLAESQRLYKDYEAAGKWYAIAKDFADPKYNLASFWYAESLRAGQKYQEAITEFQSFLTKHPDNDEYSQKAELEIASCKFALKELSNPRLVRLTKLGSDFNQAGSNYAPLFKDNTFYFTSSRPVESSGKKTYLPSDGNGQRVGQKESPFRNTIYTSAGNPVSGKAEIKRNDLIKALETAAAGLSPDGATLYFTAWNGKPDAKDAIYSAAKNGSVWAEPKILGTEINVSGFNSKQPFVSSDGKFLIFSSDRPGGAGKFDLWYCSLRSDGSLGQPVNMGPNINTKEDEQAPYYNSDAKKLLYSSNGMVGIGGFDFYESTGDFSTWTKPRNMGYPFNSSKDDVYFTSVNGSMDEGFISSDRESACCLELFHVKKENIIIEGTLTDCDTLSKVLAGAVVTLIDSTGTYTQTLDKSGKYHFELDYRRSIRLRADKLNYFSKVIDYSYGDIAKVDTLFNPNICLTPIYIDKPIVLKNILYEFDKADLTEASKAILDVLVKTLKDNPKIEIEMSAHTDSKGTDAYNMDLSLRRAQSCVDYLISQGIDPARMTSRGYGESMPIAPNTLPNGKDNPEGRELNRRTEFKVTKK